MDDNGKPILITGGSGFIASYLAMTFLEAGEQVVLFDRDPDLPGLNVAEPGSSLGQPLRWVLSNSFAFGGANATLVFGRD